MYLFVAKITVIFSDIVEIPSNSHKNWEINRTSNYSFIILRSANTESASSKKIIPGFPDFLHFA